MAVNLTGTEAMFADLGHFNIRSVQLILGKQRSFGNTQNKFLILSINQSQVKYPRWSCSSNVWPTFIVAVSAAIIASQAMISGAFAIISQSQLLGCFPRVKVLHTSKLYEGQVYIPEVNFILGLFCVIVTFGFQTSNNIGNAYGICVTSVMVITTILLAVVMLLIWRVSIWLIIPFCLVFASIELVYLSSVLYKFKDKVGHQLRVQQFY
ncbi:hypothetical protein U9M48_032390 [Paspalum notatum var. saurae]|uniref:K+ potassium transporter integral membrane domain-containing protein n=1 Tax=Paspalum notatum var. saurae TaxID=547442 RepID=A0AAQ3X5D8_PASNO